MKLNIYCVPATVSDVMLTTNVPLSLAHVPVEANELEKSPLPTSVRPKVNEVGVDVPVKPNIVTSEPLTSGTLVAKVTVIWLVFEGKYVLCPILLMTKEGAKILRGYASPCKDSPYVIFAEVLYLTEGYKSLPNSPVLY